MSHTKKDRPYWVQSNDPEQSREEDHDHRFLGKVYYYNKPVLDNEGNPIIDVVPIHSTPKEVVSGLYFFGHPGGRFLNSYTESRAYSELGAAHHESVLRKARLLLSSGRDNEPFIVGYREAVRTVETVSRIVADHCTINEPLQNRDDLWSPSIPCSHSLLFRSFYYRNRPTKNEKVIYHSGKRLAEKAPLKKYARSYNNGEDLEEYDTDIITTRIRFHNGWWD